MEARRQEKLDRKRVLHGIRCASIDLDTSRLRAVFQMAKQGLMTAEGDLFSVMSALRTALDTVERDWLFGKGMEKAIQVRIPGSVILSDSMKLGEKALKYLAGHTYVRGNRALIWTTDKVYYCDISAADIAEITAQHNDAAVFAMKAYIDSEERTYDPTETLNRMIIDSGCLVFDYDDAPISKEFDCDETQSAFQEGWLDELRTRLDWAKWLETATEAEIESQIKHDPSVFEWMLRENNNGISGGAAPLAEPINTAKVISFARRVKNKVK